MPEVDPPPLNESQSSPITVEEPVIHVDRSVAPLKPEHHDPLTNYVKKETSIKKSKDDDELIDIHVGNPLRKITKLLEDIKKEKAFSFTLKGSLGLAGIALVIGTFGIFGGTKALCSKGIQSKIGQVRALKYVQASDETVWDAIPFLDSLFGSSPQARIVMIDSEGKATRLKGVPQNISIPKETTFIATGEYDSCSGSLEIAKAQDVEILE